MNYAGNSNHPTDLSAFAAQIAAASPDSAPGLFKNREAQLAYWLNAYNALVLQSFAADYPQKRERLTGVVGRASFFYRLKHKVGGKVRSLGDLEDTASESCFMSHGSILRWFVLRPAALGFRGRRTRRRIWIHTWKATRSGISRRHGTFIWMRRNGK